MTTTLWIVGMIAMAVIGAWVGYYKGYRAGNEYGVRVTKGNILFDGIERIIESVNNDPSQCVSVCSKRRTPNEDTNVKLRKIACKFTDEENARKVEKDQADGEDVVLRLCVFCKVRLHGKCEVNRPADRDMWDCASFVNDTYHGVTADELKIWQSNVEAAESAKVHHREGTRYIGSLVEDMGYTIEEAGEAEMKALSDRIIITHPNHKPIRIMDGNMEFIEVGRYGNAPDCESDDCKLTTFCGGDGDE